MTNKKALYLGLGIASLWMWVFRGVSALKVGLKDIRLVNIAGDNATLQVTIYLQNPLLVSVVVRSITGVIRIMGKDVGIIDYPISQRIKARSINYLPVQVHVDYISLGDAVWANIQTGTIQTLTVELDGTITAGEKHPIKLPIRKLWTYNDIIQGSAE